MSAYLESTYIRTNPDHFSSLTANNATKRSKVTRGNSGQRLKRGNSGHAVTRGFIARKFRPHFGKIVAR